MNNKSSNSNNLQSLQGSPRYDTETPLNPTDNFDTIEDNQNSLYRSQFQSRSRQGSPPIGHGQIQLVQSHNGRNNRSFLNNNTSVNNNQSYGNNSNQKFIGALKQKNNKKASNQNIKKEENNDQASQNSQIVSTSSDSDDQEKQKRKQKCKSSNGKQRNLNNQNYIQKHKYLGKNPQSQKEIIMAKKQLMEQQKKIFNKKLKNINSKKAEQKTGRLGIADKRLGYCELCQKQFSKQDYRDKQMFLVTCDICDKTRVHKSCILKQKVKDGKKKVIKYLKQTSGIDKQNDTKTSFQDQMDSKSQNNIKWKCKGCELNFGNQAWNVLIKRIYYSNKKNFLYRIRVMIMYTQFHTLSKQQLVYLKNVLQDKTLNNSDNNITYGVCNAIMNKIPILSPYSLIYSLWSFILFGVISFKIFEIPLVIAFRLQDQVSLFYQLPILAFFIFEIVFSFYIGYFEEGLVVLDKIKIKNNYLKGKFKQDVFTIFFFLLSIIFNKSFLALPFLLRAIQVQNILDNAESQIHMSNKKSHMLYITFALTKLLNMVFFVAHFLGCGFHYIAIIEIERNPNAENWLYAFEYQDLRPGFRYIHSLYFSIISMSTIGYGDISPQSINERLYIIASTCISCGVFAFSLNVVTTIFQDLSTQSQVFKQQKSAIIMYMLQREINNNLQIKVIKNMEHQQMMEQSGVSQSNDILNSISSQLVKEVKNDFFLRILKKHILFTSNFSDDCLAQFSLYMEECTLAPEEIIYEKNQESNKLYFIFRGSICEYIDVKNIRDQEKEQIIQQFQENTIVGLDSFFTERQYITSSRSMEITQLLTLSRDSLYTVLKNFPLDYERFKQIQDQIKMQSSHSLNYKFQFCQFCSNYGHDRSKCPYIHPHFNKSFLLLKNSAAQRKSKLKQQKRLFLPDNIGDIWIQERRYEKIHTFYDCINNEFNFENNRSNVIQIRKKYVLEYLQFMKEKENQEGSNSFLPFDFFNVLHHHISEEYTEDLTDEIFLEIIPGIIINQQLEQNKQIEVNKFSRNTKQQAESTSQSRRQSQYSRYNSNNSDYNDNQQNDFNFIDDFDYNFFKDENRLLIHYYQIYSQAKEFQFYIHDELSMYSTESSQNSSFEQNQENEKEGLISREMPQIQILNESMVTSKESVKNLSESIENNQQGANISIKEEEYQGTDSSSTGSSGQLSPKKKKSNNKSQNVGWQQGNYNQIKQRKSFVPQPQNENTSPPNEQNLTNSTKGMVPIPISEEESEEENQLQQSAQLESEYNKTENSNNNQVFRSQKLKRKLVKKKKSLRDNKKKLSSKLVLFDEEEESETILTDEQSVQIKGLLKNKMQFPLTEQIQQKSINQNGKQNMSSIQQIQNQYKQRTSKLSMFMNKQSPIFQKKQNMFNLNKQSISYSPVKQNYYQQQQQQVQQIRKTSNSNKNRKSFNIQQNNMDQNSLQQDQIRQSLLEILKQNVDKYSKKQKNSQTEYNNNYLNVQQQNLNIRHSKQLRNSFNQFGNNNSSYIPVMPVNQFSEQQKALKQQILLNMPPNIQELYQTIESQNFNWVQESFNQILIQNTDVTILFLNDFEKAKTYQKYFKSQNINEVLERYEQFRYQKEKDFKEKIFKEYTSQIKPLRKVLNVIKTTKNKKQNGQQFQKYQQRQDDEEEEQDSRFDDENFQDYYDQEIEEDKYPNRSQHKYNNKSKNGKNYNNGIDNNSSSLHKSKKLQKEKYNEKDYSDQHEQQDPDEDQEYQQYLQEKRKKQQQQQKKKKVTIDKKKNRR